MNLPKLSEWTDTTAIHVSVARGIVNLYPLKVIRGHQDQKWHLTVKSVSFRPLKEEEECYVHFGGVEYRAKFADVKQDLDHWLVTFKTIIPDAAFWADAEPGV